MKPISAPSKKARARSRKIAAPADLFEGWHYAVHRCHWELFGLFHREFMRDEKPYMSWAQNVPPRLDFTEGTVFHAGAQFVQIAFVGGDGFLEVHVGTTGQSTGSAADGELGVERAGWLLRETEFVEWLRTGRCPPSAAAVTRSSSNCNGLLRLGLPTS